MDKYIISEISTPFGIAAMVLSFVVVLSRMFDIILLAASSRSPALVLLLVVAAVIPFLGIILPASFLVGCSVAFNRLSVDMEVVAFRSLGISLRRVALPAVVAGAVLSLICLVMNLFVVPWGNRTVKATFVQIMLNQRNYGVVPGTFTELFDGVTVYAAGDEDGWMRDMVIFDMRERGRTKIAVAKKGRILRTPSGKVVVDLVQGRVISVAENGRAEVMKFSHLTQSVYAGISRLFKKPTKKELTLPELLRRIEHEKKHSRRGYLNALMHLNKRFSLAFTPLVFALLVIPLSITFHRESRWSSIVISLVLFVAYYSTLSFVQNFVYRGLPPVIAAWIPNAVFGGAGAYLYAKKTDSFHG